MMTSPILEEIYQTQQQLDEETQHNLKRYAEAVRRKVLEIAQMYNVTLQYEEQARLVHNAQVSIS